MIANGESNGTLRISTIAAEIAREHGSREGDEIRKRFFDRLDAQMDKTGPDRDLVNQLDEFKRQGFRMGIVTFVRKPRISRRLNVWALADHFQSVITPDDEPDMKPSPRPFVKAMRELHVAPKMCYMIGDEPVDMIGAKKAGATTIGLPQGFFSREELKEAGADYIVNSVQELPKIVFEVDRN